MRRFWLPGWAHGDESLPLLAAAWPDMGSAEAWPVPDAGAFALRLARESDPPVLVGWSAGAILALDAACRGARIRALVLIAATPRFCSDPAFPPGVPPARLRALRAALRTGRARRALEAFHRDCAWPGEPDAGDIGRRAARALDSGVDRLVAGLDYLRDTDLRDGIRDLRIPTLLLHGDADRVIPVDASRWLHSRIPGATLRRFAGEGHRLPLDRPDAVARESVRFLERLGP